MSLREVRIVVASPSDVNPEREVVSNVISELNATVAWHHQVVLRAVRWEKDASPRLDQNGAQGAIDPVLDIKNADIVIGILWTRLGTPTADGTTGTEHEIGTAYNAWKQNHKKPRLMVYFKEAPYYFRTPEDAEQASKLLKFKSDFLQEEGLIWSFATTQDFERELRSHLTKYIYEEFKLGSSGPTVPQIRPVTAYDDLCAIASMSITKKTDVFALSAHNIDEIYDVDRIAADYETEIRASVRAAGGSGANTSYALAQLGLKTSIAGAAGCDEDGIRIRKSLEQVGIDTSNMYFCPDTNARTGRTIVITDRSGRRSIFVDQGTNEDFSKYFQKNYNSILKHASRCRHVHISSFVAVEAKRLCEKLCEELPSDVLVSFTPGTIYSRQGLPSNYAILARANVVFFYQEQFEQMMQSGEITTIAGFRKALNNFFSWRVKYGQDRPVILSVKGSKNIESSAHPPHYVSLSYGRKSLEGIIFPETEFNAETGKARFELGAGDALAAGVIYSLLKSFSVQNAVNFGQAMAEFAVRELDARAGLADRGALRDKASQVRSMQAMS